ncbi:MAG: putative zinc-binding metallopeptidase [Halobacteriovoraceae bacterium]|nr:putative zinc-binding metallopeptidase [Halobacteriovoraceae bacterium]
MANTFWKNYSDSELLDIPINQLGLSLKGTMVERVVKRVYAELAKKKIRLKSHVWISDDWFSPDGIPGIAIPFFVLHPRLIELEYSMMGDIEGESASELTMLIRHELGHVLDNAFHLRMLKKRQQLFGLSSTPYPESYEVNPKSKDYVRHIKDFYAQAHPDEDWAETFAVWLGSSRRSWEKKYKNWGALKKLQYLDEVMKSLQGKRPKNSSRDKYLCIERMGKTLGDYYIERKRARGLTRKCFFAKDLQRVLANNGRISASAFLRKNREQILPEKDRIYQTMFQEMVQYCRENELFLARDEKGMRDYLAKIMKEKTKLFIRSGRHKYAM